MTFLACPSSDQHLGMQVCALTPTITLGSSKHTSSRASTMENSQSSGAMPAGSAGFNMADLVKTPHNGRLYKEVQHLKKLVNDLVDYQLAHPKHPTPATREGVDNEKQADGEIEKQEKYIRAQLSIIKSLYRQSILKVREEKSKTSDDRAVNDALILDLHNLKYEEQSLRSEISAAENYEYAPSAQREPDMFADEL
jgi:THO complex subunit 5